MTNTVFQVWEIVIKIHHGRTGGSKFQFSECVTGEVTQGSLYGTVYVEVWKQVKAMVLGQKKEERGVNK